MKIESKIPSNVININTKNSLPPVEKTASKSNSVSSIQNSNNVYVANNKIQEIQNQIKDGKFKISPEAIADKLLDNEKIKQLLS